MKEIWRQRYGWSVFIQPIFSHDQNDPIRLKVGAKPHCILITAPDISLLLFELSLNIIIKEQNVGFAVKRPKLQNSTDSILGINLLTLSETGINNWANFLLSLLFSGYPVVLT